MDSGQPQTAARPRRRRGWRVAGLAAAVLACLAGFLFLYLPGRQLDAPEWLRSRIEARIERNLNGLDISFGRVRLVLTEGWRPRAGLRDVVLRRPDGSIAAQLADARAELAMRPLLRGRLQPKRITLSGLYATLRRDAGSIALSLADSGGPLRQAENLPALIEQWDATLATPALAALTEVKTEALTLRYEDARLGRVWTLDGGHLRLARDNGDLDVSGGFSVLSGRDYVSAVELSYRSAIGDQAAEFGVVVREVASEDIAAQAPALAWLGVLRAPISGSLRGGISAAGGLLPLAASLQIGEGVLQPEDDARPVPFTGARSYFSYDPQAQTLRFDELTVDSGWGSGTAVGQAMLNGIGEGTLRDLVGQFTYSNLTFNPKGLYEAPLQFEGVRSDFKLELDPFRLRIGEMLIDSGPSRLRLSGEAAAGRDGWTYAMDGSVERITLDRVKALWPARAAEKPRDWVVKNLHAGVITGARLSVRGREGQRPVLGLSAAFEQARLTFQKHMPDAEEAAGQISLLGNRFTVMATAGRVQPDQGAPVAIAGTAFIIPDLSVKKAAPGVVRLKARGGVVSALSLLNRPPLQVLAKAGLPVALARGRVEVEGTVSLPLAKNLPLEAVAYHYRGRISGVESDVLVPGQQLSAAALAVEGDHKQISISGAGSLSGIPVTAVWRQKIGKGSQPPGRVSGEAELSQAASEALNLGLPPGTFAGAARGQFDLQLVKGGPPRLTLRSDLAGLGVRIPALGWSKPEADSGRLELAAVLDRPARVENLELEANGLAAQGQVLAAEGGGLERADFSTVQIGSWMNGPVRLIGRQGQAPEVRVEGGIIDLRKSPFGATGGSAGGGAGGSADSGPIRVALTRLQVTDSIALGNFRGEFSARGGFNGEFAGDLNGQTRISGQVVTRKNGVAVRIGANDAGGVFRAAGVLRHGSGGRFEMTLLPSGTPGVFDGSLKVRDVRVKEAPSMAALLNAVSLIGLLDELTGRGILFSEVEAGFKLGPSYVQIEQGSAVGPSMGLSLDGYYDTGKGVLNMRGVLSPIYLVNVVGRPLARKGEGLFGFAFELTGTSDAPQVAVNPLSALMPGVLRDIMRRKVPTAPGTEAADPPRRHVPPDSSDR